MTHFKTTVAVAALTALVSTAAVAGEANSFTKMDANANGSVDFTEFYNAHQAKGMNDTDIAIKFSKLAGAENSFNAETYNSMAKMMHKDTSMAKKSVMSADKYTESTSFMTADSGFMTAPAASFASFDANADGQVSFKEYAKMVGKDGVTSTAAAQQFIRISEGQKSFDASQFDLAMATNAVSRPVYASGPNEFLSSENFITPTNVVQPMSDTTVVDSITITSSSDIPNEVFVEETEVVIQTPEVAVETDLTTNTEIGKTMSNMTNSGTVTDLDTSNNPQMKVWGESATDIIN
ncbi:hypothetical protein N9W89_03550 [Hellea sp.]|nr:hypothetical protein [Hellea sp.]